MRNKRSVTYGVNNEFISLSFFGKLKNGIKHSKSLKITLSGQSSGHKRFLEGSFPGNYIIKYFSIRFKSHSPTGSINTKVEDRMTKNKV